MTSVTLLIRNFKVIPVVNKSVQRRSFFIRSKMVDKDENVGNSNRKKILCLFDVDGPLTKSRGRITPEMSTFMESLKDRVDVGLVGGSDLPKIAEQVSRDGSEECLVKQFLFVFAQNGLVAYIDGVLRNQESIVKFVGEEKLQTLINFCLRYLSEVKLPCKRGNFIEFRSGMINVCPVGRSCSQAEREAFAEYDKQHKIREALVEALRKQFGEYGLNFAIGGQISIDIFPQGWDKTYCLQFVSGYQEIHFFGDKTGPGGNDHEIFEHERTIGHTVTSPEHTKQLLTQLFF